MPANFKRSKQPFRPDKNLGQHWLVDPAVVQGIVHAAQVTPGQAVLEIGPGQGVLTKALLAAGAKVLAIDLDRRAIGFLQEDCADAIENKQLTLHHGDILAMNPAECMDYFAAMGATQTDKLTVVGNLPYQITSRILVHFCGDLAVDVATHPWRKHLNTLVVMVQKEVGDRLQAVPSTKAYNALSIAMQRHNKVAWAIPVIPPKAFKPPPKVTSGVITLTPRDIPLSPLPDNISTAVFQQVVRGAFAQRRKTLKNTLGSIFDKEALNEGFAAVAKHRNEPTDHVAGLRAEALSIADFVCLSTALAPHSTAGS